MGLLPTREEWRRFIKAHPFALALGVAVMVGDWLYVIWLCNR